MNIRLFLKGLSMRIKHIEVKNLFGIFDHIIPLYIEDRITIIYGPNGFGKTFTLMLINELFNPGYGDFFTIPFTEVAVDLEDESRLSVKKLEEDNVERLFIEYNKPGSEPETFHFENKIEKETNEPLWLRNLKESVHVSLIQTERLKKVPDEKWESIIQTIKTHSKSSKDKMELFVKIINSRFYNKQIDINDTEGIKFTITGGKTLDAKNLSSGEQQILALLYELLFIIKPDTLILIDEPELSLHVAWQQEFLRDLQDIIRLVGFDVLIATHSPQIIHDRWDLAVEFKDPRG